MNFTRILLRQITLRSGLRVVSTETAPAASIGTTSKNTNSPAAGATDKTANAPGVGATGKGAKSPAAGVTGKEANAPAAGSVSKSSNAATAGAPGKPENAPIADAVGKGAPAAGAPGKTENAPIADAVGKGAPAAGASIKVANAPAADAARKSTVPSTAEKLVIPPPEGVDKPINPKLEAIVNNIAALNLLEVSELSSLLKKRLNLPETAFASHFAAGPVVMSAGASTEEEEEQEAPKKVQTAFKVKLIKFDEKQKVALIKEVKNLLEGMNLVQAKKFVESAPTIVKEDLPKEEAEKLKEALTKAGAIIEIE